MSRKVLRTRLYVITREWIYCVVGRSPGPYITEMIVLKTNSLRYDSHTWILFIRLWFFYFPTTFNLSFNEMILISSHSVVANYLIHFFFSISTSLFKLQKTGLVMISALNIYLFLVLVLSIGTEFLFTSKKERLHFTNNFV